MKFPVFRKIRTFFGYTCCGMALLAGILLLDVGYLIGIWPDWDYYEQGPVKQSSFIRAYSAQKRADPSLPRLRWNPVTINQIPRHMIRALIVAEDSRFYFHSGIDTEALKDALEINLSKKRFAYGASTISQQTVKNMFLSPSRNPLRKWHELVLTLSMERNLSKRRILEMYLNVAEFGRGIFGVDAAARYYWGVPASELSVAQAIELAATLPSPINNNPKTRTKRFQRRVKKISRWFEAVNGATSE